MDGFHCLKYLLKKYNYKCKISLYDACFSVPLLKEPQALVRCHWEGILSEFFCLSFGLEPAPRVFTKLLKVLMSVLRCLMIQVKIFLEDLQIFGNTLQEILMTRDSVIFPLQLLGFVINFKKWIL